MGGVKEILLGSQVVKKRSRNRKVAKQVLIYGSECWAVESR